ncbi:metalloreductase STEAP3 [Tachyglossus aculeatus]|uniref:metalloreductase STEAP3 n=1 Tax=Tachyglossus aculeatus TaxID=9261 RepID=UPI0018F4D497|nr:metalloreductase STEAP3 [Tachyglossus aculeatus]
MTADGMSGDMAKPLIGPRGEESEAGLPPPRPPAPGRTVAILGSGDFARSLASRLVGSGFRVLVGSRNPKRVEGLFPDAASVVSQAEAVGPADVVFVAVFRDHYRTLGPLAARMAGKILVDVSNAAEPGGPAPGPGRSNAEHLASLFPASLVVKAFNGLSAWSLQQGPRDGNRQVPLCGDQAEAKARVGDLARAMGFWPADAGTLASAWELEARPLGLLPSWRLPARLALLLFLAFYVYNAVRDVLQPYVRQGRRRFYLLPLALVNRSLPCAALVLLALVYAAGLVAAGLQLRRGTKYRPFPAALDRWMRLRKQLGLLAFLAAALHGLYSACLPLRRAHRYRLIDDAVQQVASNVSSSWKEEEVWRMEIYLSLGILALGLLSVVAVTSLPSVADALNWTEFNFVQSRLGLVGLTLATLHTLSYGWTRAWAAARYPFYLPPPFTLALAPPCAVLAGRALLLLPWPARRLARIRRGWEGARARARPGPRSALPDDDADADATDQRRRTSPV